MEPKLRVAIRLDVDLRQARLVVRGKITEGNCRVLYVLARRTNAALPGLNVLLDLRKASITEDAMAGLTRSAETGELPVLTGSFSSDPLAPRQLSILA
ncbi:hypothetical protein [Arthrobacter sp. zg-Y895]|uniref:hypothetical protein n=1 Tax=Arthrobacter sp. zg-Y895 TaxID=2886933 RepID=UPI001D14A0A9|nr:hypothetical protein [Arthrobacter sp. zg-Y895]MCC3300165.1 hypothetical protein [Arthrobacter sp. zg-Y895]